MTERGGTYNRRAKKRSRRKERERKKGEKQVGVKEYRCKNCDGRLNVEEARNGVIECPYCHSVFTMPKESAGEIIRELLQIAEHELDTGSFERAYTAYKKSAETDRNEPESYYGMALSEHKVQYLKDTVNNRLQPICHEISGKRFTDNVNYKEALSLATQEQRKVYEAKAEEIESIRKEFKKLKDSGVNYDCFLCTKVTDGNGGNTRDSYETLKMYNYLKEKGYSFLFGRRDRQENGSGVRSANTVRIAYVGVYDSGMQRRRILADEMGQERVYAVFEANQ